MSDTANTEEGTSEMTEDDEEQTPERKPYNDYDLISLEELPQELAPISGLIEIVQQVEKIK